MHCRRDDFHCDVALNRLDKSLTEKNGRAREDVQSSAYKLHTSYEEKLDLYGNRSIAVFPIYRLYAKNNRHRTKIIRTDLFLSYFTIIIIFLSYLSENYS